MAKQISNYPLGSYTPIEADKTLIRVSHMSEIKNNVATTYNAVDNVDTRVSSVTDRVTSIEDNHIAHGGTAQHPIVTSVTPGFMSPAMLAKLYTEIILPDVPPPYKMYTRTITMGAEASNIAWGWTGTSYHGVLNLMFSVDAAVEAAAGRSLRLAGIIGSSGPNMPQVIPFLTDVPVFSGHHIPSTPFRVGDPKNIWLSFNWNTPNNTYESFNFVYNFHMNISATLLYEPIESVVAL